MVERLSDHLQMKPYCLGSILIQFLHKKTQKIANFWEISFWSQVMKTTTNSAISVFFVMVIMLMPATVSCIRDSDNIKPSWRITGGINHLDITNARSLVIAGGDGAMKSGVSLQSDEVRTSLYKITDDGEFEEIKYYRIDTLFIETDEGVVFGLDSIDITPIVQPVAIQCIGWLFDSLL
jgi:hypothetical protein